MKKYFYKTHLGLVWLKQWGIIGAFGIYLGLLSMPAFATPSCEKAWQSPAQKAQDIFQKYKTQIIQDNITVDIDFRLLREQKKPVDHRLSLFPSFKLMLYEGELVVLKPLSSVSKNHKKDISEHYRELLIYRTLQELNIPTLFKGVTRREKTSFFMVLKFQEGEVLHLDKATHTDWFMSRTHRLQDQTVQDLKEIRDLFLEYHIFPQDFQILLSKEGKAYIFDVEYYDFLGDSHAPPTHKYAQLMNEVFKTNLERRQMLNKFFENLGLPAYFQALMTQDPPPP